MLESEQQADSALSVLHTHAVTDSSILMSAMIVVLSVHIDVYRYEEAILHIEKCQYEVAYKGDTSACSNFSLGMRRVRAAVRRRTRAVTR